MSSLEIERSPLWWVQKLEAQLDARRKRLELFNAYYEGNHPFPFVTKAHQGKMHDEFARMLKESRSNFCRLVVDAVEERLSVEGFRLSAKNDPQADEASWDIWQANNMDQESATAILDSLVKGVSYLSVWPGAREDDYPIIAVEDASETIVCYTPGSGMRRRDAALKVWEDDYNGVLRANLYLPEGIHKFYTPADPAKDVGTAQAQQLDGKTDTSWRPLPSEDERFVPSPFGIMVVPIIPLRNRPRTRVEGESELADVTFPQNQINGFTFLLALAGYFGAHRQRWATGVPLMQDDSGNYIEPWDSATDKLWTAEHPDVKFGEFGQTELQPYISAIEQKVLHIAVTTRTPRHYLIQEGQSPSGDAIRSAESGLVKKAERKMRPLGEGFEEAVRLARMYQGQEDAPVDSEIVWGDADTPTEAETTDATIKKYQANLISKEQALEDLGYTQTQIARMMAQGVADGLLRALTDPKPDTTPADAAPVV